MNERAITKIYLDTNILERYISKDIMLDDKFFNEDLFRLIRFIKERNLISKVFIVMPKIVIEEMKTHFSEGYHSSQDSFKSKLNHMKNLYGPLFNFEYKYTYQTIQEYIGFFEEELVKLLDNNSEILSLSNQPTDLSIIINRAIEKKLPFAKASNSRKDYTDAGFKDVILLETILSNYEENHRTILFSDDNDFINLKDEKCQVEVAKKLEDVLNILEKTYEVSSLEIKELFEEEYMRSKIFESLDLAKSADDFYEVIKIEKISPDATQIIYFDVQIKIINNETEYAVGVLYDYVAGQIIRQNSKTLND